MSHTVSKVIIQSQILQRICHEGFSFSLPLFVDVILFFFPLFPVVYFFLFGNVVSLSFAVDIGV